MKNWRNFSTILGLTFTVLIFQNCADKYAFNNLDLEQTTELSSTVPEVNVPDVPESTSKCTQRTLNISSRNLRISFQPGATNVCLGVRNKASGEKVMASNCHSEFEIVNLELQNDCTLRILPAASLNYHPQLGSTVEKSNLCWEQTTPGEVNLSPCSDTELQKWKYNADLNQMTNAGLCLEAGELNTLGKLVKCDAGGKQRVQFIDADQMQVAEAKAKMPISMDYWDSQGSAVSIENLTVKSGYKEYLLSQMNNTRVLQNEASATVLEYEYTPENSGDSILSARYAAPLGAKFQVYQDGKDLGTWQLRSTLSLNRFVQGGNGFLIKLVKGVKTTVRITTEDQSLPLRLINFIMSPPLPAVLPNFGTPKLISATESTTLKPIDVSDSYRLPMASNSQGLSWPCPWTFCFIEYTIDVKTAGNYRVEMDYVSSNSSGIKGKRLTVDSMVFKTIQLPSNTEGKASWDLMLSEGLHTLKFGHPDYDLGPLAESVTTKDIRIIPTK